MGIQMVIFSCAALDKQWLKLTSRDGVGAGTEHQKRAGEKPKLCRQGCVAQVGMWQEQLTQNAGIPGDQNMVPSADPFEGQIATYAHALSYSEP